MAYTPRPSKRRSRKKKEKIQLTMFDWIGMIAFAVIAAILIALFIFLRADIGNVANDFGKQAEELGNEGDRNSKGQFTKQYDYKNEVAGNGNDGKQSDNNVGFENGKLTAKENGVLITDMSINPSGLPLYDGWTMNVDNLKKVSTDLGLDPNSVKSWDINYSQFWNTENFSNNPALYGLGDFTNSKAGSKNMISCGQTTGYYRGKTEQIQSSIGTVSTYDGRVLFAVSGRIFTDPDLLTEELLIKLRDNCGLNRTSVEGSTRDYSNGCYKVTYNGDENMIHDWSNCVPNNVGWKGVYFDILFDDGTVLAGIMADGKGVHVGGDKRGSYCEDTLSEGYGQVRFNKNNPDNIGYQTMLELYSPGAKNNGLDIQLASKRVVGIRTYNVNGVIGNSTFLKWFELSSKK